MMKYIAASLGLKLFSSCQPMRRLYRTLGNELGVRRRAREQMPEYYVERVKQTLQFARAHGIVDDGARVFELGTGWLHWEAITTSLFFDVEAVLFDVWDNRQLSGLKNYLKQLRGRLGEFKGLVSAVRLAGARQRIDAALAARNYEELYERFRFQYIVDSSGMLTAFPGGVFDLVMSRGVLEHVDRDSALQIIKDTYRILKPQGWALHDINTGDHLSYYDRDVHPKLYLGFPEWLWVLMGQNKVQYINRLQRGEWIRFFDSSGFKIAAEDTTKVNLNGLRVAKRYQKMLRTDLESNVLLVLLQRGN